jgi:broad specificity phosphatase PhoE
MVRVYLIRHGQGPNNIIDKSHPASGWRFNLLQRALAWLPVTPRGAAEARGTARTLRALSEGQIDRLYTSPFGRARATARIIGRRLGVKPDAVRDLREIGPGLLDGDQPRLPLALHYLVAYAAIFWPGSRGESWYHGLWRARAVWGRLTAQPARQVAIVSHNWFIGTLLLYLRLNPRWRVVHSDRDHGGVTVVEGQR